jgi:hypothetical protein
LLEDGNQLGIWMATSALIAIWLWRRRLVAAIFGIPIAWISGILFVVTLLCQSVGSIILLLCLLPFVFLRQSYLPRAVAALFLLAILAFMGLRVANFISLRSLVEHNPAARSAAQFFKGIQRQSFGWRLSQDERYINTALEEPLLGTGAWDWWRTSGSRPWGLWLLALGLYGLAGLLALEGLQLIPVARILWSPLAGGDGEGFDLRNALAAAILMSAIDNLLNGSMILPLLLVIGGLSTQTVAVSAAAPKTSHRATTAPTRRRA